MVESVHHGGEVGGRLPRFLSSLVAEESPVRARAGAGCGAQAAAG